MTAAPRPEEPAARLERALEAWLQFAELGGDPQHLLAAHDDLRDLLEPMLEAAAAAAPAEPSLLPLPDEPACGDFRLLRELGRGGMGIVYEAWQRSLDRKVALKVLAPALVADAAAVARFRREAAAVAKLHHPGIVEVFGFGQDAGRHWFAMALVDGQPLSLCRERFRAPAAALLLVAQVVDALQHAHAAGLVHRDVKPGNVLVRADGSAVLTDFGLASDASLPSMTAAGSFLGTLEYASPEQVQGEPVDARTDVWSAGVLLHELVTGQRPFVGSNATSTMRAILTADPPDPRRAEPTLGADFAAVLARAMAKDPQQRYPSAVAFLADLRALQSGGAVSARASTAGERLAKWARREPWRAATLLLLLLAVPVLTGLLGYLWANQPRIAAAAAAERRAAREEVLGEAWLCIGAGDVEGALTALPELAAAPDDLEVAATAATALRRLGRVDEARAVLQPLPPGPLVQQLRSWVDDRPMSLPAAPAAADPTDPFACFLLADLHRSLAVEGDDSAEHRRRSAQLHQRAAMLAPQPRICYLTGWLLAASYGADPVAVANADAALQRHFPDSPAAAKVRAVALLDRDPQASERLLLGELAKPGARAPLLRFNLALAYEKQGRIALAVGEYRAVVQARPRYAKAWNNLGMLLRRQKDQDGAVDAFRHAVAADSNHAKAWNNLGIGLRALGRPAEAQQALERAIALQPGYAVAHYNLGNLRLAAKDHAGAIAAFRQAVAADPGYVAAHANLGNALRDAGHRQEALLAYARAAQLAPDDLIPHYNLARVAIDLRLFDLALPAAERAVAVGAKNPDAHAILAEVLLGMQPPDGPRALASVQQALALAKDPHPEVRFLRAQALAATGAVAPALQELDQLRQSAKVQADASLRERVLRLQQDLQAAK